MSNLKKARRGRMSKQLKLSETILLNYNGVKLRLHLNYETGKASFVKPDGQGEKFLFKDRTIDYLGGWIEIFRALEKATFLADTKLREQSSLRESAKEEEFVELMIAVSDIGDKKAKS